MLHRQQRRGLPYPLFGVTAPPPPPEEAALAGLANPAVAVLNSLVLGFLIARSRAWGWTLVGAVLVMFIGVYTVLTHIESIAFLTESALLPPEMLPPLVLSGVLLAVLFVPAAVWLLGKWRAPAVAPAGDDPLKMPAGSGPGSWC